jgi:hypothetical protein
VFQVGPEDLGTRAAIDLLVPLLGESGAFRESLTVSELALQVVDAMKKLASLTVHANTVFVELLAQFGLEVGGYVWLFLEFIFSVCVRAGGTKLAFAVHHIVLTKLGLLLGLVSISELLPLFGALEGLLLGSSRGFAEVVVLMLIVIVVFLVRAAGGGAIVGHILYMYIFAWCRLMHAIVDFWLNYLIVIISMRVTALNTVVAQ